MDGLSDDNFKKGIGFDRFEIARAKYATLTLSRNSRGVDFKKQEVSEKITDPLERMRLQHALDMRTNNISLKAPKIIYDCHEGWRNLNIIYGSFFDNMDFLFHKDNFCFIDPPYLFSKRGIMDNRTDNTGYDTDLRDNCHIAFLYDLAERIKAGNEVSKIMICSNFELDDDNNLIGLQEDLYNKILLPCGFRLVEVMNKPSTEVSKNGKKKRKVEVVYINYHNISDYWYNHKYYDYEDIYGNLGG